MTNNWKKAIDRQMWVGVGPAPNAHAAGGSLCSDLRNDVNRHPQVFQLASAALLNKYNLIQKSWSLIQSPALAGTFGAGAGCVFAPASGLTGTIGSGCTTTSIVTTTAATGYIGVNMLANRGGGTYGYRVRITGNASGSSGKTEERWIVGNTQGYYPTLTLDTPLTFTPISGDKYEILSGRIFMLNAGTLASGIFKSFDVAANTLSICSQTSLPGTISTDCSMLALDELYVPYNNIPGEGFLVSTGTISYDSSSPKHCCAATNTSSILTLTGMGPSLGGDSAVLANEYRNFQIRIVEDTFSPTAVGQRRIIASHTAGPSPVYTLGTSWSAYPSSVAKYVIEYPNLIVLWTSGVTQTYTYNYSGYTVSNGQASINNDQWHLTYFTIRPAAMAAGCTSFPSFGIVPDTAKNARHSYIYSFRGGGVASCDVLDIAGATNGAWTAATTYDGGVTISTGSCGCYAPYDQEGKFGYLNSYTASATNQLYRFDVKNRVLTPITPTDWIQAGTAAVGDRVACYAAIDGSDTYTIVLLLTHLATNAFELLVMT